MAGVFDEVWPASTEDANTASPALTKPPGQLGYADNRARRRDCVITVITEAELRAAWAPCARLLDVNVITTYLT
jgi:hypothetical protein